MNTDPGERNLPDADERAEPRRVRAEHQGLGPRAQLPREALQGEAPRQQPRVLHHHQADIQHARGENGLDLILDLLAIKFEAAIKM